MHIMFNNKFSYMWKKFWLKRFYNRKQQKSFRKCFFFSENRFSVTLIAENVLQKTRFLLIFYQKIIYRKTNFYQKRFYKKLIFNQKMIYGKSTFIRKWFAENGFSNGFLSFSNGFLNWFTNGFLTEKLTAQKDKITASLLHSSARTVSNGSKLVFNG